MILLVSPSQRAQSVSDALHHALSEPVQLAPTIRRAVSLLRNAEFSAVVLDEPVVESEPEALEGLLEAAGIAPPVYVNLAISSSERIIREVRSGLRRYNEERLVAMRAAATLLRTELRGAVAGILLSTELALRIPSMPNEALDKLKSVCQLAGEIRTRLEAN